MLSTLFRIRKNYCVELIEAIVFWLQWLMAHVYVCLFAFFMSVNNKWCMVGDCVLCYVLYVFHFGILASSFHVEDTKERYDIFIQQQQQTEKKMNVDLRWPKEKRNQRICLIL